MSRERYQQLNLVSLDYETHLIKDGLLSPPVVCGSFLVTGCEPELVLRDEAFLRTKQLLEDPTVLICGANISFDFGCFLVYNPNSFEMVWAAYEQGRIFDVSIAATLDAIYDGRMDHGKLFLPDGSTISSGRYSLQACVRQFLGRDDAKRNDEYRLRYAELDGIPLELWPEVARQYPLDDAKNTYDVALQEIQVCNNLVDQSNQAWTALCIHLGCMYGLGADALRVKAVATRVEEARNRLRAQLLEKGIFRDVKGTLVKNTKVVKSLVDASYDGAAPVTPKGGTSTSRRTLSESADPTLQALSDLGRYDKLATYVTTLRSAAASRLTPRVNILLATGRTSYDGLIQLMPKEGGIRECFKFDGVGSSVDYAAIEMAAFAEVQYRMFNESALGDAINEGLDPHSLLGADLLNCEYKHFVEHKVQYKDIRYAAKAANFGFLGMMGAARFVSSKAEVGQQVCEWFYNDGKCKTFPRTRSYKGRPLSAPLCTRCLDRARILREKFIRRWEPEPFWKRVSQALEQFDGKIPQFVSGRVRGGLSAPQAANTLFQGLAADGAKAAVRQLTKEMYLDKDSPLYGSILFLFAHDETIIDIPNGSAKSVSAAADRQTEIMITEMRKYLPRVKVSAEPALMKYWYKEAQTLRDEKGLLQIWEPRN